VTHASTCAAPIGFNQSQPKCGELATEVVTVRHTIPAFDCERRPACAGCGAIQERIVTKYFPTSGTITREPMPAPEPSDGRR
jgi:hypothetical protein